MAGAEVGRAAAELVSRWLKDFYLGHAADCSRVDSDGCGTPASTSAVAEPFASST
jgi:hypothetical protein